MKARKMSKKRKQTHFRSIEEIERVFSVEELGEKSIIRKKRRVEKRDTRPVKDFLEGIQQGLAGR